jgi:cytochrome c oxidase subunit 1
LQRLFEKVMSVDVHLHDTLFVVSTFHAKILGLVLLSAALVLHEIPKSEASALGWIQLGLLASLLGILGFVSSVARLGTLGMPRRYMAYFPEFTALQIAVTISALVIVAGALGTAIGLVWSWSRSGSNASSGMPDA